MTGLIRGGMAFLGIAAAMGLSGCGDDADDGATATLAFANDTGTTLLARRELDRLAARGLDRLLMPGASRTWATLATALEPPTSFEMKLIAAYVTEDIDPDDGSNVGATSMIYLNPDCSPGGVDDIMHCDISAGTAEDGAAYANIVTSYFDFAQDTADVNTALNAQPRSITPATYKYARLEFCKTNDADEPNIKWNHGSIAAEREFQRDSCTVNSAEFETPIVVAAGGTVAFTLSYDLSETVQVETAGQTVSGDDCENPNGTDRTCFTLPAFTPSAE